MRYTFVMKYRVASNVVRIRHKVTMHPFTCANALAISCHAPRVLRRQLLTILIHFIFSYLTVYVSLYQIK